MKTPRGERNARYRQACLLPSDARLASLVISKKKNLFSQVLLRSLVDNAELDQYAQEAAVVDLPRQLVLEYVRSSLQRLHLRRQLINDSHLSEAVHFLALTRSL